MISEMASVGLEQYSNFPEKTHISKPRGTNSGTLGDDSGLAGAIQSILKLPLSPAEKSRLLKVLLDDKPE